MARLRYPGFLVLHRRPGNHGHPTGGEGGFVVHGILPGLSLILISWSPPFVFSLSLFVLPRSRLDTSAPNSVGPWPRSNLKVSTSLRSRTHMGTFTRPRSQSTDPVPRPVKLSLPDVLTNEQTTQNEPTNGHHIHSNIAPSGAGVWIGGSITNPPSCIRALHCITPHCNTPHRSNQLEQLDYNLRLSTPQGLIFLELPNFTINRA